MCNSKILKTAKSLEEQIKLLEAKGLIVSDKQAAKEILSNCSYYFITGYLYQYKSNKKKNYLEGIKFDEVYKIIKFDMRLKNLLMYQIDYIERSLKNSIASAVAEEPNGNISYLDKNNFHSSFSKEHDNFISIFNENLRKNKKSLFVKHHLINYNGILPIWVAIEVFTLGNLEKFYLILNLKTKEKIAKHYNCDLKTMENWISSIRKLRNILAHNSRIYNHVFLKAPRKIAQEISLTNRVFDHVYLLKLLCFDKEDWNNYFLNSLETLISEYSDSIKLKDIGFSEDWKAKLEIVKKT